MGIYCIHAAVDLFGEPSGVSCRPVYGPNGADVEDELLLTYADGFVCEITTSKQRNIECGYRIEGTRGFILGSGALNEVPEAAAGVGGREFPIRLQEKENRMIYELARFRDAIRTGDTAFFMRMYCQSRAAAGVLEDAHKQMAW